MKKGIGVALCLLLCLRLGAQELIQIDQADPPFMYAEGGAPAGLYPAIVAQAFSRMGVAVGIDAVPWKRALAAADSGSAGIAGIYKNSERLAKYDFSRPFYLERLGVYSRGGALAYAKLQDLYGKTVGVIAGWSYGDEFDAAVKAGKIRVEAVSGDEGNMRKLALGRVDAVLAIVESAELSLRKLGLAAEIRRAPAFLASYEVHLAFAKSAGKAELLARFDDALRGMKADGSFDSLVAKLIAGE